MWRDDQGNNREAIFGPANLQLIGHRQLIRHFRAIASALPNPRGIGIGMAGARTEADRRRVHSAADAVWPRVPCAISHDLAIALEAADGGHGHARREDARILVLSGTGSCCYGESASGEVARVGGWGHVLGDHGSGYHIAISALQRVVLHYDRQRDWPRLGSRFLAALHLPEPNVLPGWVHAASKAEIAGLSIEVFRAAAARDVIAGEIIREAASHLATNALACAQQLAHHGARVRFILAGGVLVNQPVLARRVMHELRRARPGAAAELLKRPPVEGAIAMARRIANASLEENGLAPGVASEASSFATSMHWRPAAHPRFPTSRRTPPTEERNPRSLNLDTLSTPDAVQLFLDEDAIVPTAVRAEKPRLVKAVRLITRALEAGGRLFYVGAGTSGRLGVLDASECPPTFGTPLEMIQGIIAGGPEAMFRAIEGAEDDFRAGAEAIRFRRVNSRDVVVGIAASGRTPFVWGALTEASQRRVSTILICANPYLQFARGSRPTVVIALRTGPEILTGSTRLKAGTATKLILNLFTTLAMVGLGKVRSNLMIDLTPGNRKLRDRAIRITAELMGTDAATALAVLERSGWVIQRAVKRINDARRRTRPHKGQA
jgi:N-acetylmuramic acid 6-phosphate etherase